MDMRERLFLISGILGIGAILGPLLFALIGPREIGPMVPGFISPVIAFEFAESGAEVWDLFRPVGSAEAMDRVNRWDFLYMVVYNLFLFTFAMGLAHMTGRRYFYIPAALAGLILVGDVMENVQLLALTYETTLDGNFYDPYLARLRVYTWLKWGGLAVYCLLMAPYFRRLGDWSRFTGYVAVLPAILAIAAWFNRGLLNELMALAIGVMFVLFTVHAWRWAARPAAALEYAG
jgi:hypothetical protein